MKTRRAGAFRNNLPANGEAEQALNQLNELVDNVWSCREDLFSQIMGGRNQIWTECNYPDAIVADVFRQLFDRMAIAERVVQLYPKESWQVMPEVYEEESGDKETEFEKSWAEVGSHLYGEDSCYKDEDGALIWTYLHRADVLSGIGVFGVILLGVDDGRLLEEPLDGVEPDGAPKDMSGVAGTALDRDQDSRSKKDDGGGIRSSDYVGPDLVSKDIYGGQLPRALEQPYASTMGTDAQYFQVQFSPMRPPGSGQGKKRKLLFLRVFDESLVQVVQYEASMYNKRFGQPLMYRITLNDPRVPHTGVGLPLATVRVHWSRVIHIADNLTNSEIFGVPRMRPVLNNILDLQKLYGGSAEGYWRSAFTSLSLETHPQLGGDVIIDKAMTTRMMQNYYARLNRWLVLTGMSAKTLAPQVISPQPFIDPQIEAICYHLGCPKRVFMGSERGELASSQDDADWNGRLTHRQHMHLTPRIIVPFVNRLIQIGVLPEPKQYYVDWPDLDATTDKDKAAIAQTKTMALSSYVQANCETVIAPHDFLTKFLGFSDTEAEDMLDTSQETEEEDMMTGRTPGGEPEPPPQFGGQSGQGGNQGQEAEGGLGGEKAVEGEEGEKVDFSKGQNGQQQQPKPQTTVPQSKAQLGAQTRQQKQQNGEVRNT
jgi:hypothetical protein